MRVVTNRELLDAAPALQRLAELKMPARAAFGIAKNLRLVQAELQDFETARIKLLERFGKLNEARSEYVIPDEQRQAWEGEYAGLLDAESGLTPYRMTLGALDGVEGVTPGMLAGVLWMLDGE